MGRWPRIQSHYTSPQAQKENEMSTEFTREDRYIVFKLSDVERYLTDADKTYLAMMKNEIDAGRDCANKPPFKGLIVESDWPEYEPTWKAIEARVTGAQPAPIIPKAVMEVIAGLVYEVERNICPHEETHRGGQWEICDMCGARWADDMGGKPEFKWPEIVEKARDMLAAATEAKR